MLGDRFGAEHHFETPMGRARALYRIPTAPNSNRTLELCHATESLLQGFAWPGTKAITCELVSGNAPDFEGVSGKEGPLQANIIQPLPFDPCSFDMVILHRTLDQLAKSSRINNEPFDPGVLFQQIFSILAPGGLVAGCIDKRSIVKSLKRWFQRNDMEALDLGLSANYSKSALHSLLTNANFVDVRLFDLIPSGSAPLRLVDSDPTISKLSFRHEIEGARRHWSPLGYTVRRVAVSLGIYSWLEESVFFWAYKPC